MIKDNTTVGSLGPGEEVWVKNVLFLVLLPHCCVCSIHHEFLCRSSILHN